MKFFLVALILYLVFKYLKDSYHFSGMKEKWRFYLMKVEREIEENPLEPLFYCRRGSIYQRMQDFPKANENFRYALKLINDGHYVTNKEELKSLLLENIKYTEKPLPWSKNGAKNLSNSVFTFFLIERFGYRRTNF